MAWAAMQPPRKQEPRCAGMAGKKAVWTANNSKAMPTPSPFHFGFYYNEDTDQADKNEPLDYDGERHILLFGVNGIGKSTRILLDNLATIRNRSLVVFDVKGELAVQTHRTRRKFGAVKIVNPYGMFGLPSDGYNPLSILDPDDDEFFDKAKLLTLAIIESEGESQKFFPQTAQGWFCAGIMWEVMEAKRERRAPSLLRARELCTEADVYDKPGPGATLIKGISINAERMVKYGGRQLANLAAGFVGENARDKSWS